MTIDMGLGKKRHTYALRDIPYSLSSSHMHKGRLAQRGSYDWGVLEGRVVKREAEGPKLL